MRLLTAPWRLVQHEVADIQARRACYAWVRDRGQHLGKGGLE